MRIDNAIIWEVVRALSGELPDRRVNELRLYLTGLIECGTSYAGSGDSLRCLRIAGHKGPHSFFDKDRGQ